MKLRIVAITLLILMQPFSQTANSQTQKNGSEGPYLGQTPPSFIPQLFAPELVSVKGRYEMGVAFTPDLEEIYFSTQKAGGVASIYTSQITQGKWQPIKRVSFTKGEKAGEMEPFVTQDGKHLYFTAYNRDFTDTKIWVVEREKKGWSEAKKLESPINNEEVFNSTLASNGDLFYTDIFKSQTFYSQRINGQYPEVFQADIPFGIHGFISPDQSYLIVDNKHQEDNSRKDRDLYVYFKQKDGSWSKPINLGESINSKVSETVPTVSPDGKYLFFSRFDEPKGMSNIYWVSTDVIEKLRAKI